MLGRFGARGKRELADVTTVDVAEFGAALRVGDEEHQPLAASSVGCAVGLRCAGCMGSLSNRGSPVTIRRGR